MNKQIINIVVAVLFTTVSVFANSTEPTIVSNGNMSFTIDSKIWKSEKVDVKISDQFGTTLYSDNQETKKIRQYSLENLPLGSYQVTVSNEIKTVVNDITITDSGLIVDFDAETTYKPIIDINANNIDINYMASSPNTVITILANGYEIYNDRNNKELQINKRFDISKLQTGSYTLSITNDRNVYTQFFKK